MLGIKVDLLFPNDEVPIFKVLGNIQLRGCWYSILITPQNEQNRSITLTVYIFFIHKSQLYLITQLHIYLI